MEEISAPSVLDMPRQWCAVTTWCAIAAEKILTEIYGTACYVPKVRRERMLHGRAMKRDGYRPLITGLLFVCEDGFTTPSIGRERFGQIIRISNQERFVQELRQFQVMADSEILVNRIPWAKHGQRVEVAHGPLRGLRGYLDWPKGQPKFRVILDAFHQGAETDINPADLDPIEN